MLGFYHSIRAAHYAYLKGSILQKTIASLSLLNTSKYVLAIVFYYLPIGDYFSVYAEETDGSDSVGRAAQKK